MTAEHSQHSIWQGKENN